LLTGQPVFCWLVYYGRTKAPFYPFIPALGLTVWDVSTVDAEITKLLGQTTSIVNSGERWDKLFGPFDYILNVAVKGKSVESSTQST
jgi:hypothetical protein